MQTKSTLLAILVLIVGGLDLAQGGRPSGGSMSTTGVSDTPEAVSVNTGSAKVTIRKSPWHVVLADAAGVTHTEEAEAPAFKIDGIWNTVTRVAAVRQSPDGTLDLALVLSDGRPASAKIEGLTPFAIRLTLTPGAGNLEAVRGSNRLAAEEEVYGFGEMWNGRVAQRGQAFDLYDKQGTPDECAYMPYYVTTQNYGLFLDYGGLVHFDVGKEQADRLTYEAPANRYEITLISGRRIAETVDHFIGLTGKPRIPPRWAFMPWFWLQSSPDDQYIAGYDGPKILVAARRLRALDIPVGVTWFEPRWETARNSFGPAPVFSLDFAALVKQLEDLGLRVLAWTAPYTNPDSPNYVFGDN